MLISFISLKNGLSMHCLICCNFIIVLHELQVILKCLKTPRYHFILSEQKVKTIIMLNLFATIYTINMLLFIV